MPKRQVAVVTAVACLALIPVLRGAEAVETCTTTGAVTVCLRLPSTTLAGDVPVSAAVTGQVARVDFAWTSSAILTDFDAPYEFTLPTTLWADGSRTLSVTARLADGTTTAPASMAVRLANGLSAPAPNTRTWSPRGVPAPPGAPYVVAAAGNGADGGAPSKAVSDLVASWSPNAFLYLGDVYERGTKAEYLNWYGGPDSLWGRFRDRTNPTPGNHEGGREGYPHYWDNAPHHYSWDAGGWHFVSVDSTTVFGQTAAGSPQMQWLEQDLAAAASPCTAVFFHHPTRSIGPYGDEARLSALWATLANRGVDLVLNGHDHNYQRWRPLNANGAVAPGGTTQIVAGGGGHALHRFVRTDTRVAAATDTAAHGALRMELHADRADLRYVGIGGTTIDAASVPCSGATPQPPQGSLFGDGFESGSPAAWQTVAGLTVSQAERYAGSWAARATANGSPAYARAALRTPSGEVFYRARAKVLGQTTGVACLMKLRAGSATVVDLCLDRGGTLYTWNYVTRAKRTSQVKLLPGGPWRELQLRASVAGTASVTEVWVDGQRVAALSGTTDLGTAAITGIQLGGNETGTTHDVAFDDIAVSPSYIGGQPAVAPPPPPPPDPGVVFADGFESGDLSAWTSVSGLAVTQAQRYAGNWGARATSTGGPAYARKTLTARDQAVVGTRFNVLGRAQGSAACLVKVRSSSNAIVDVCVDGDGVLYTWNYARSVKTRSAVVVPQGGWHGIQLRAVVAGTGSTVQVWYDGVEVAALSGTTDLGTSRVAGIQLGGNETGKTYDVAFDDLTVR